MKNLKLMSLFLMVAIAFAACDKDDDDDDNNNENPGYEFQDRPLQGTVEGDPWVMLDGRAEEADSNRYHFEFWSQEQDTSASSVCDLFGFPDGDRVFFTLPFEEGVYELGLGNGYTVTILDDETFGNNIATSGAVEITNISTTDSVTTVSGRIDARANADNQVNGEFEAIMICD